MEASGQLDSRSQVLRRYLERGGVIAAIVLIAFGIERYRARHQRRHDRP
jgi:hypothetical protein